jgi:addiction module HigA family antidote
MTHPHPGGIVRRQCVEPLRLSVTEAAAGLGVTHQALSDLLNGKAGISVDMAIRLSKAFGVERGDMARPADRLRSCAGPRSGAHQSALFQTGLSFAGAIDAASSATMIRRIRTNSAGAAPRPHNCRAKK